MISYSLRCHKGHEFDGWFRDSAAFEQQSERGLLNCPSCNSIRIEKAIMAPALSGTKKSMRSKAADAKQIGEEQIGGLALSGSHDQAFGFRGFRVRGGVLVFFLRVVDFGGR